MHQLVYALVFLVAHCQGRTNYPTEGWSNSNYIFTDSDLEVQQDFYWCLQSVSSKRLAWSTLAW